MSGEPGRDESLEIARRRAQAEELGRAREALHREALHIHQQSTAAIKSLADFRSAARLDRDSRLAALNLIEDAEEARRKIAEEAAERVRAQEALSSSEEKLHLIVENALEFAIFSTDLDRRVTSWSTGAERILGFSEKEIIGQPADIIFTPEDRAAGAPTEESTTARTTGRAMDERWHQRKDGTRFWGSGAMMLMRDARGQPVGFVKIMRDRTEQKRTEEALHQSRLELERSLIETEAARREAEAANRAKDDFLATLSHELRTPLTPVMMAVETLLRRKDLNPRVVEGLNLILRNVELESRFIDELLDVTRISRGKLELLQEPLDVHDTIRRAIEVAQPDVYAKQQHLTVHLAASKTRTIGDARRLQQVFWNLLKNAAKFTPNGGRIHVASRNEAECVIVEITDTGRGFDPAKSEEIFEAFKQEDTSVVREFGGLGLGLTIARATVHAHAGFITAQSHGRNQGSTFTVRLPLKS
ncbi:MAG TPA: ATP-binding protein [Verrucomicrobiae bacterium]